MLTKVQKWGNSQGVRIARQLLADANIAVGDEVDLSVKDGALIVRPARLVRGGVSLKALVRQIPKDTQEPELDWGPPVGKEVW